MDKSTTSHAILDQKSRRIKASKIITVLKNCAGNLNDKKILDIGTGAGYIASYLGQESNYVTSIDVVDERRQKKGYKFVKIKDEKLPFDDESFDIVITNHVIEHITDQKKHVEEIHRVLKKGGVAYLATPNKYWLTDPHYRLYFISWMPSAVSKKYLMAVKKKEWDIHPLSMHGIKTMAEGRFAINPTALDIIKSPEKYYLDNFKRLQPILKHSPKALLRSLSFFIPTIILLLSKPNEEYDASEI